MTETVWKDFFFLIFDPSIPFLRNAVLVGLIASIPMGLVGCFVVTLRMSYAVGAIAHANLLGIGLSVIFPALSPLMGLSLSSFMGALGIWAASMGKKQFGHIDITLTLLWMLGASLGIIFISQSSNYFDPARYLFGSLLLLTTNDLMGIIILSLLVVPVFLLYFRRFTALSFDQEYLYTRGVAIQVYRLVLFLMLSFVIVLLTMSVGLLLVVAMIGLPSATAILLAHRLSTAVILSIVISWLCFMGGIIIGYVLNIPAGAVVVLCAGICYLTVLCNKKLKKS